MKMFRLACASMIPLALLSTAPTPSVMPLTKMPVANGAVAMSGIPRGLFYEVRLRKVHLVRPDLIPFPIEYEVYC